MLKLQGMWMLDVEVSSKEGAKEAKFQRAVRERDDPGEFTVYAWFEIGSSASRTRTRTKAKCWAAWAIASLKRESSTMQSWSTPQGALGDTTLAHARLSLVLGRPGIIRPAKLKPDKREILQADACRCLQDHGCRVKRGR